MKHLQPRSKPGFSRYEFHPAGVIINRETRKVISKSRVSRNSFAWKVVNDAGKEVRLYKKDVDALFPLPGKKAPYQKLSPDQIEELLQMKGKTVRELAQHFGVHFATISRLLNKATRKKSYFDKLPKAVENAG